MPVINQSKIQHILISRIDAIGDVVLTIPMAAYLKELFPQAVISFLGRTYTGPVITSCAAVDIFLNYDELLKLTEKEQVQYLKNKNFDAVIHVFPNKHIANITRQAAIPLRIGTTNRVFHWFNCNKLVKLSRKNSALHEAQLNLVLLKPLGLTQTQPLPAIIAHYHFECKKLLPQALLNTFADDRFNLIIHPKSHGSAAEWGLINFAALIDKLPAERYNIIITGSDKEKPLLAGWIKTLPNHVIDMTGKMSLDELIAFIFNSDGLIAASTGPLHLAAAAGINALGLYPSQRPTHPGRWAALGKKAAYLESHADGLNGITTQMVLDTINNWHK